MSSKQFRDPHVKDKTVSRPSYLQHGNPHTWERRSLYWDGSSAAMVLILHHKQVFVFHEERFQPPVIFMLRNEKKIYKVCFDIS